MENTNLDHLRHSAAHLLAASVIQIWPNAKRTIGPAIDNGFYFDFDFGDIKISENDFSRIEQKMHEIAKTWVEFTRYEKTSEEAKKEYPGNEYKHELIDKFASEGQKISFYKAGDYSDLCEGGHVKDPKKDLKHFKLLSIAGAYWHGSEKNKMLTRIYGTIWPTKEELQQYLLQLEEAKKYDHRKIGEALDLYTVSDDVGRGLILWLPKGNIIKEQLEEWAKKTETKWGYQRVTSPHITKSKLYYTSGHLPYYKTDMYPPMKLEDGEEYFLKPMNCPHHHMIYKSRPKSYKDLPLRFAEYGTCYRYEASGQLFGMMRVRGFTQNDSHIYCTVDQAVDEFLDVMKLHEYYYKTLGITEYHLELALRDPKNKEKYHGDDAMWELAESLMRQAVAKTNIKMVIQIGNAAFYGPKIDFIVHSSIGREFAVSTNQIDLFMGKQFGLTYKDNNGLDQTPVIIHRAPLGSHERFIGFLIEHYKGAFPLWLNPTQVEVLTISEKHTEYAKKITEIFQKNSIRVHLNDENASIGKKIRQSTLQKTSFMIIIGDKEIDKYQASTKDQYIVSVRTREGKDLGQLNLNDFISELKSTIEKYL